MTHKFYRNATICLSVACLLLTLLCVGLALQHYRLAIRLGLAVGDVETFELLRADAMKPDITESKISDDINYVTRYYPSGTKQIAGSHLDQLVEHARQSSIREMTVRLREISSRDPGSVDRQ